MWIFSLKSKDEAHNIFSQFMQMVERNFVVKIKQIQYDRRKKFQFLSSMLGPVGIIQRKYCPHIAEKNGVVETRNRLVVERG